MVPKLERPLSVNARVKDLSGDVQRVGNTALIGTSQYLNVAGVSPSRTPRVLNKPVRCGTLGCCCHAVANNQHCVVEEDLTILARIGHVHTRGVVDEVLGYAQGRDYRSLVKQSLRDTIFSLNDLKAESICLHSWNSEVKVALPLLASAGIVLSPSDASSFGNEEQSFIYN